MASWLLVPAANILARNSSIATTLVTLRSPWRMSRRLPPRRTHDSIVALHHPNFYGLLAGNS